MKIYSEEHKKALDLKHKMDVIEAKHLKFINDEEAREKTMMYQANKEKNNARFDKIEKAYNDKEDVAYSNYYHHMNKCFEFSKNYTPFMKKKYKEHFVDEKFINDMYKKQSKLLKDKKNEKKRKSSKNI